MKNGKEQGHFIHCYSKLGENSPLAGFPTKKTQIMKNLI